LSAGSRPVDLVVVPAPNGGAAPSVFALDGMAQLFAFAPAAGGGYGAPSVVSTPATPLALHVMDFDGNGTLDAAVIHDAGLAIFEGAASSTMTASAPSLALSDQVRMPSLVGGTAGDFDGDGKPQLLVVWTLQTTHVTTDLTAVGGTSAADVYAVGASNLVLHHSP